MKISLKQIYFLLSTLKWRRSDAKTLFMNPFFSHVYFLVTFHIGMLQENGSNGKLKQQLPLKIYNLMHNRGARS